MKLSDILKRDAVIEDLGATTKKDVLCELLRPFAKVLPGFDRDTAVDILLEREKLGSTGVGEGIAIPHGKIAGLNDLIISFGRSAKGVDYDAMDGKPVHLFFMLMAPDGSAGQHLKALAKISRMLKDVPFRRQLMAAESPEDLYGLIVGQGDLY